MKYNNNSKMRNVYYRLLDSIAQNPKYNKRYQTLQSAYNNRRDSDIKEELLVEVLSSEFAAKFEQDYLN
jgi:hypothetical protein